MNQFGEKIKQLRIKRGLLQREIAHELGMDTPMLSKIEKGMRNLKREQIPILAEKLNTSSDQLITLWLADQIYAVVKDEKVANEAMDIAEGQLKKKNKSLQ
jgi:transcriptional regulator with XRE-family HTH domain